MKRKASILILLTLALTLLASAALADAARVFDQAGLFSSAEKDSISEAIASFQKDTGMDFVVVTSSTEHDDASQQQVADEFYNRGGFGLDEEKSGVLYYIDMYERWHYISTTGQMIDYMTGERIASAIETCKSYLSSGNYAGAVDKMLSIVRANIQKGIPEGQFRYDVVTGQRLTARHKVLETNEIVIGLAIAVAVALIFMFIVRRTYKLKGSTYHYNYQENSALNMTVATDDFLRTTTTRNRKAESNGGGRGGFGGGGGGGFSGGSGVHTSSGGTMHGGGGGRF